MKASWERKALGEILKLEYGKPLPISARASGGKYAVYGANGIKDRSDEFYYEAASIIVGRKGSAGEITLAEEKFWPLDVTYFVTFDRERYELKFLYYLLLTLNLTKMAKGVKPGLNRHEVYARKVLVPLLADQKRIVAILDKVFAGLTVATANAEKNLRNARELFAVHLNSILAQRDRGWGETTLGAEVDLATGFAFKSNGYTKAVDGIRLLRGDNIGQNALRWDDVKRWPSSDVCSYEGYRLQKDDVVLAMDRTWIKAGLKYAVVSKSDLPSLLVQRVARLRCRSELDPRFLSYIVGSGDFANYVLGIQTGLSVPHVSGKQIADFKFARPDFSTQRRIGEMLDKLSLKCSRLDDIYQRKVQALSQLQQSILRKAFAGELNSGSPGVINEAAE